MMTSGSYTVQLTAEQKELFDNWLLDREKELEVKLEHIRSLRRQSIDHHPAITVTTKSTAPKVYEHSWASKIVEVIKQSGTALTSTQIVAWLMQHDQGLKGKDKRYVTKNVTSKLVILVNKGQLEKHKKDGKNIYMLKSEPDN